MVQEGIKAALDGVEEERCLSELLKGTLSESTKDVFKNFSSKIYGNMHC